MGPLENALAGFLGIRPSLKACIFARLGPAPGHLASVASFPPCIRPIPAGYAKLHTLDGFFLLRLRNLPSGEWLGMAVFSKTAIS